MQFTSKAEKDEIGSAGIYKGKPIPRASATLEYSFSEKERASGKSELETMLQQLKANYEHIKACGVEDITLTLVIGHTGDGACWHLEHEELKKIVELGIGLSIDWYHIEDESSYSKKERSMFDQLIKYKS